MKDITLKIIGKQISEEGSEETLEFVTEGQLYERNGATYLIYEESEFSGFPGCKTSLKLTGDKIRMKRIGEKAGFGTEMVFQEGKRFTSSYETPYGEMELEILTNKVNNRLTSEGMGSVDINYHVSLSGMAEGRNELSIEVMK